MSVPHGDHDFPGVGLSHQPRDLKPHHIVVIDGLRVTSVARTLCDLAAIARRERLARAIEVADQNGKCPIADTVAMYEELRRPGKPGFKVLGQILACRRDDFSIPPGHLERLFRRLLRKYSIVEPAWEAPLPWDAGRRADGIWYRQKTLVELDSRTWHGRIDQMTADRRRDREARRHGLEPYRFTYEEVRFQAAKVAAELRDILGRAA